MTLKVADTLRLRGDAEWLRGRASVILFEECWHYARQDRYTPANPVDALAGIATSVKNKNAAGLGSLAHAVSEGNSAAFLLAEEHKAIRIVNAAMSRPSDFFKWAIKTCPNPESLEVVHIASQVASNATWPWDKAFIYAGAYLAISEGTPAVHLAEDTKGDSCPYWVGIDKHTAWGKVALQSVSKAIDVPYARLQWASFYFESVLNNQQELSPWWELEKAWRFKALNWDVVDAAGVWEVARPKVEEALSTHAAELFEVVNNPDPNHRSGFLD